MCQLCEQAGKLSSSTLLEGAANAYSAYEKPNLISWNFATHTLNLSIDNGSDELWYYIIDDRDYYTLQNGLVISTYDHAVEDEAFIENTFDSIDKQIDLDFRRVDDWLYADIVIYCYSGSNDPYLHWDYVGLANQRSDQFDDWWDLLWKDTDGDARLSNQDKWTIVHEIGHILGLSHPNEEPNNTNWDSDYTVMSYNIGSRGYPSVFTQNDINTLISIWGPENDRTSIPSYQYIGTASNDVLKGYSGANDYGHDYIKGGPGNDTLYGYRGSDELLGGQGSDELRAGNGKDILKGGSDADTLYGGFGLNTFIGEVDGVVDALYLKSDHLAYNYIYGKAGNSPTGEKADKIGALDPYDLIFIQGADTSQLSFGNVSHVSNLGETFIGIGIYAAGVLEAVYVGGNLSASQLQAMTSGASV